MATLEMTIEQLQERMDAVGDSAKLSKGLQTLLKAIRLDLVAETKANFEHSRSPDGAMWPALAHPRPNSKGDDKPLLDRGMLRSSVTSAFSTHNVLREDQHGFEWGTNLYPQNWVHQNGATIRPVNAKFLAIPATMKAKHAGSPRDFPGELSFRFGKRGGVAFTKSGKGKGVRETIQYYFAKSVVIPPRPFLGLSARMTQRYEEMVADWYETAVVEALERGTPS